MPYTTKTTAELLADGSLSQKDIDDAKISVDKLPLLDVLNILCTLETMGVPVMTPGDAYNPYKALKYAMDTSPVDVGVASLDLIVRKIGYES